MRRDGARVLKELQRIGATSLPQRESISRVHQRLTMPFGAKIRQKQRGSQGNEWKKRQMCGAAHELSADPLAEDPGLE